MEKKNINNSNLDVKEQLKLKEIDQLHAIILQFSKNTLQLKTICSTVLIGILAVILKITGNKFDLAIIWCSLVTVVSFWIIDSFSYYYQRNIREKMIEKINKLMPDDNIADKFGIPLSKGRKSSIVAALFNWSHIFYYIGLTVIACVLFLYLIGLIN